MALLDMVIGCGRVLKLFVERRDRIEGRSMLKLRNTEASTLARPNTKQYPSETNHIAEIDRESRSYFVMNLSKGLGGRKTPQW